MQEHAQSSVGRCPRCETLIRDRHVLIEYERTGQTNGMYADCPGCDTVVTPR